LRAGRGANHRGRGDNGTLTGRRKSAIGRGATPVSPSNAARVTAFQGISDPNPWSGSVPERSSPAFRRCPMRQIKTPLMSDDKMDAILPVAGTLIALIIVLIVLVV
jgi:hypothetical protein